MMQHPGEDDVDNYQPVVSEYIDGTTQDVFYIGSSYHIYIYKLPWGIVPFYSGTSSLTLKLFGNQPLPRIHPLETVLRI